MMEILDMVGEFHMTPVFPYRAKVGSLVLRVMISPQAPVRIDCSLAHYRSGCHTDEVKSLAKL